MDTIGFWVSLGYISCVLVVTVDGLLDWILSKFFTAVLILAGLVLLAPVVYMIFSLPPMAWMMIACVTALAGACEKCKG